MYKKTYTRRHIQEDIYKKTYTRRHIQEDIYKETYTRRHIQEDIHKKTYPGNSNRKTDSICESDEKNLVILERKNYIEKNILPRNIKWCTVGPQQSRVDGSMERS